MTESTDVDTTVTPAPPPGPGSQSPSSPAAEQRLLITSTESGAKVAGVVAAPAGSPFMSACVGGTFDGLTIDYLYGADKGYIVFESKGVLHFHTDDSLSFLREASDMLYTLSARVESDLGGAYWSTTRSLLGNALVQAFDATSAGGVAAAFKTVEDFITEHLPVQVFGRGTDYAVFMDKNGVVRWDYPAYPAALLPAITEFEKSMVVATTVMQDVHQKMAKQILGNELTVAFRSGANMPPLSEVFAASRDFIYKRVQATATNSYVAASLVAALGFGAVLLACIVWSPTRIVHQAHLLAVGALAGMIGASISVLQRSATLEITPFALKSQLGVQAVVRMTLGIIFGALTVIAVKGKVAFGAFDWNNDMLFIFAVAAGFSERLVPDLLTNLAKNAGDSGTNRGEQKSTPNVHPGNEERATPSGPAADKTS